MAPLFSISMCGSTVIVRREREVAMIEGSGEQALKVMAEVVTIDYQDDCSPPTVKVNCNLCE